MASHVFSEIYLHINWHTDGDLPSLKADVENFVHTHIKNRCKQTKGVFFEGVGGTETHIHLAIRVEPFVVISDLVGDLKGASSFDANKQFKKKLLIWQRGFGVVSFGRKQLPWVLDYIANQKEHHSKGSTHAKLEMTEDKPSRSPAEAGLRISKAAATTT